MFSFLRKDGHSVVRVWLCTKKLRLRSKCNHCPPLCSLAAALMAAIFAVHSYSHATALTTLTENAPTSLFFFISFNCFQPTITKSI